MEIVPLAIEFLRRALQKAGPYLMVEIVLPGGTLLALALLLYRHTARQRLHRAATPTLLFPPPRSHGASAPRR